MTLTRREFVRLAAAMGASLAWGGPARASTAGWQERRELYPEGVASGDPDSNSVILWTRRPYEAGGRHKTTTRCSLSASHSAGTTLPPFHMYTPVAKSELMQPVEPSDLTPAAMADAIDEALGA